MINAYHSGQLIFSHIFYEFCLLLRFQRYLFFSSQEQNNSALELKNNISQNWTESESIFLLFHTYIFDSHIPFVIFQGNAFAHNLLSFGLNASQCIQLGLEQNWMFIGVAFDVFIIFSAPFHFY